MEHFLSDACHLLHALLQCVCCDPDITSMSESDWFQV